MDNPAHQAMSHAQLWEILLHVSCFIALCNRTSCHVSLHSFSNWKNVIACANLETFDCVVQKMTSPNVRL